MIQNSLPLFLGITIVGFLTYTRLNPIPVICYGCDEGKNTWYKCIAGTGQDSKMCKNIKKMDTKAEALKNSIIDHTTSGFDIIRETTEESIDFILKIFEKIKNTILGLTDTIASIIKKATDFFIKSIVTVFNKIKELFIGQNPQKRNTLADPKKKRSLLEKIKTTIIDPLYNGIISIIVSPINKLIKILIGFKNKIIKLFEKIASNSTGLSPDNFKISKMVGFALKPFDIITDVIVKGVEEIINIYKKIIEGTVNIGIKALNFSPNMWMAGIEKTIKLPFQTINITRNNLNKSIQKSLQIANTRINKINNKVIPINKAIGKGLTGVEYTLNKSGKILNAYTNIYRKSINFIINTINNGPNNMVKVLNSSINFIPNIMGKLINQMIKQISKGYQKMRDIKFPTVSGDDVFDAMFPMCPILKNSLGCIFHKFFGFDSFFVGGTAGYPCWSGWRPGWCTKRVGKTFRLSSIIADTICWKATLAKVLFKPVSNIIARQFSGKTLFRLPNMNIPEIPTLNLNLIPNNMFPTFNIPKIPKFNLSNYTSNLNIPRPPKWSIPTINTNSPSLKIPHLTPPNVKLPRNLIPEISIPGIKFPDIPSPSEIMKPHLKIFDKLPEWLGITTIINKLKSYIIPIIQPIVNLILKLVSLKDVIIKGLKFVLKFLWENVFLVIWETLGNSVKKISGVFDVIIEFFIKPIKQVFEKISEIIREELSRFVSIISESFKNIKDTIIDSFTEIFKLVFNFTEKYLKTSFGIFLYVVGTFVDKILWFLPISITWKMLMVLLIIGIVGGLGGAIIPFLKIIKSSQGTLINIINQINNYLLNN